MYEFATCIFGCDTWRRQRMESLLVLVRHGESEWNKLNLFTGWRDPGLSEKGVSEAIQAGRLIKAEGLTFDIAFTSALQRAQKTLTLMLEELGQPNLPTIADQALNERDYGDLSGLNKDEARAKWGAEQVHIWRRSYDIPPPGGESLKDTAARVIPYYKDRILPLLTEGKRVLISAHGNSLRALIMHLENIGPKDIVNLNLATGEPYVYRVAQDGRILSKKILVASTPLGA